MKANSNETEPKTFRLVNQNDANLTIDFEIKDNEDPCSAALEVLGWGLVVARELEDEDEQES